MNPRRGNVLFLLVAAFALIAIIVTGYFAWSRYLAPSNKTPLTWEECLKVPGAATLMTYPGQCVTPDGRKVIQPLTPAEQKKVQPPGNGQQSTGSAETADWKTYTDTTRGFSIKYPPNWKIDQTRSNRQVSGDDLVFDIGVLESHVAISVDPANGKTLEDIINTYDQNYVYQVTDVTVDNEKGKEVDTKEMGQSYTYVLHNDRLYTFTSMDDWVLSTFQFLDKPVVNCLKDADCPQGYKCSANCDVNAPGGADCSIIGPPQTCVKSSP